MATSTLAPAIRTTVENFVRDLQRLLASAAIDAVHDGSLAVDEAPRPARVRQRASPPRVEPARAPAPRGTAAAAKGPVKVHTLDDYERAAIQRALVETDEVRLAAAKLLGMGKSTMHRRLRVLGVNSSKQPVPADAGRCRN